jgi:hypothetical protein
MTYSIKNKITKPSKNDGVASFFSSFIQATFQNFVGMEFRITGYAKLLKMKIENTMKFIFFCEIEMGPYNNIKTIECLFHNAFLASS